MPRFSTILTQGHVCEAEGERVTVMVRLPPKKGPRMTVVSQRTGKNQDTGRDEFETRLDAFARKTHDAIEDARSRMTDADREEADRKAKAILERATAAQEPRLHSA